MLIDDGLNTYNASVDHALIALSIHASQQHALILNISWKIRHIVVTFDVSEYIYPEIMFLLLIGHAGITVASIMPFFIGGPT